MTVPVFKTFLVEECVMKQVCSLPEDDPIWNWLETEGPIIRAVGRVGWWAGNRAVLFETQYGDFLIDTNFLQEVLQ